MTLGQKIRELRTRANLSLRELQKKVDADFTYLSKIENDKTENRPPSEELLKKIARVLNGDEQELLSLAGRIPEDVEKRLAGNKYALDFLRSAKDMSSDEWKQLKSELEEKRKGKNT